MDESHAPSESIPGLIEKPPGTREFTIRAIVAGVVVAALMGASYPYVVLKLGFGPNVSVVAAFFGYLFLGILFKNFNRWENNIVQTAGTSAAQTAFMCVSLAAFDLVSQNKALGFNYAPSVMESFLWLTAASILGVLLAVPLRQHYIVDEKLTFADGVAAAETIVVLDARGEEAKRAASALFIATLVSGIGWFFTTKYAGELLDVASVVAAVKDKKLEFLPIVHEVVAPAMFGLALLPAAGAPFAGFAVSLLGIGSGMIVGNRINISMAIGAVIAWVIGPRVLYPDIVESLDRNSVLLWMMWPGTGMLIAGGLTALFLKWRTLKRTFTTLNANAIDTNEFPIRWVIIGCALASIMLVIVQVVFFGVPFWITLIAIIISVPLMLVGLRVLGETNWGPITQLTNMTQAIFAGIAPGNLMTNLAMSGTTGTVASQSEAIMQDYKAGHLIGSTPKFLTYSQLIAAPIGALAVALIYPALKNIYGVGGDNGLSAPGSRRIAGFSEIVVKGIDALPPHALEFMVIGAVLGIVITLAETKWRKWLPSPTGVGIGMMVPGFIIFTMVFGGILMSIWNRVNKGSADKYSMPLASGLIAGEALMAILIPVLIAIGIFQP